MSNKFFFVALFISSLINFNLQGQSIAALDLKGVVVDGSGIPVSEVSVVCKPLAGSGNFVATSTDINGNYGLRLVNEVGYEITYSKVGYQTNTIKRASNLGEDSTRKLIAKTTLQLSNTNLSEVKITGVRSYIEKGIDNTVVTVSGNPVFKGYNTLDIFKMLPGITTDVNDNIQIRGNSHIKVLVDGREVRMSGEALKAFLKSQPPGEINSIEIASNPGSKFDAEDTGGIINIKKRRNDTEGIKGAVSGSYSENGFNQYFVSPSVQYKHGKTTASFNGAMINEYERNIILDNRYLFSTQTNYRQENSILNRRRTTIASAGVFHEFDEKRYINFDLGFSGLSDGPASNYFTTLMSSSGTTTLSVEDGQQHTVRNPYVSFNYHQITDSLGSTFDVGIDAWDNFSNNERSTLAKSGNSVNENVRSKDESHGRIYTLKADYLKKYKSGSRISLGGKIGIINDNNDLQYPTLLTFVNNQGFGGKYSYDEWINSVYTTGTINDFKGWQVQAGLRLEQTSAKSTWDVDNSYNTSRIDIFPSIFFLKKFKNKFFKQLTASYTRRINRPKLRDLNPVVIYSSPYSFRKGNLYLTPEFVDKYESSVSLPLDMSLNLTYEDHHNVINGISYLSGNSNIFFNQSQNIAKYRVFMSSLDVPFSLKNLRLNSSILYTYDDYEVPAGGSGMIRNAKGNIFFNLNAALRLKNGLTLRGQTFYKSAFFSGQTLFHYRTSSSVSILKEWKSLSVSVTLTDPFKTNKERYEIKTDQQIAYITNSFNSRKLELYATYSFGSGKKFSRKSVSKGNRTEIDRKN